MRLNALTQPRFAAWLIVITASLVLCLTSISRAKIYGATLWSHGHDLLHYGTMARNQVAGNGFRVDAFHVRQFEEGQTNLNAYVFSFVHPLAVSALMRWLGDTSFTPVFYTTALYWLLGLPLLFLVFLRFQSPLVAAWGVLLFVLSPAVQNLNLLGLTETLMIGVLSLVFIAYFYVPNVLLRLFLMGLALGVLNISRATGLVLLPAFALLTFKTNRWIGTALFAVGFAIPSSVGSYFVGQGQVKYSKVYSPVAEVSHYGGPSLNYYRPKPPSSLAELWEFKVPVLKKVWDHSRQMVKEIEAWWGALWVFVPPLLILWYRRRNKWFYFTSAALVLSTASVVFFWYDYRVTLHVIGFSTFFALLYFKLLRRTFSPRVIGGGALMVVPLYLLLRFLPATLVQASIAVLLSLPLLGRASFRRLRPLALTAALALVTLYQLQLIRHYTRSSNPSALAQSDWLPFQSDLQTLAKRKLVDPSALIVSERNRDITWYLGNRSLYLPENTTETLEFLKPFAPTVYFILAQPPSARTAGKLQELGFTSKDLGLKNLWFFSQTSTPPTEQKNL